MPVREREEIQEMLRHPTLISPAEPTTPAEPTSGSSAISRRLAPALLRLAFLSAAIVAMQAAAHAAAPIFPDQLGDYKKTAPQTLAVPDRALMDEYGLQATEAADYAGPDKKHFIATAWRFLNSTGAMAMFEARRPPKATPSKITKLAVATSDGVIFTYGNYLLQFTGSIPQQPVLEQLYDQLPLLDQSSLPLVLDALPSDGLIPNSERYIEGPVSLQRFDPGIPPSVAAFHFDAEAQLGQYQTPKGKMTLAVFSYPSASIAKQQYDEFAKVPGAVAKRAGPMIAVTVNPPDPDAAEKVLAQVKYASSVTLNQMPPVNARQVGGMIISIMMLAGIILFICVVAGIGFGVFRVMFRKLGWLTDESTSLTTLHLGNK